MLEKKKKKAQGYAPTTKQTHKGREKNKTKLQTTLQCFTRQSHWSFYYRLIFKRRGMRASHVKQAEQWCSFCMQGRSSQTGSAPLLQGGRNGVTPPSECHTYLFKALNAAPSVLVLLSARCPFFLPRLFDGKEMKARGHKSTDVLIGLVILDFTLIHSPVI